MLPLRPWPPTMDARVLVAFLLILPVLPWTAGAEPAPASAWGRLETSLAGAADEWVVVRHALPVPTDEVHYRVSFTLHVAGPSPQALVLPPTLVSRHGVDLLLAFSDAAILTADRLPGGRYEESGSFGAWTSGTFEGFVFAVGATAPWTLDARIELAEGGPTVAPERVVQGSGIQRAESSPLLGAPSGPAGVSTLAVQLDKAGWSHVEVDRTPLQPDAVRTYDVAFPSGHVYRRTGYGVGVDALVVGQSDRTDLPDGIGTFRDAPGPFRAEVRHAEASVGLTLRLMSLQGADQAFSDLSARYLTFRDPFMDPL